MVLPLNLLSADGKVIPVCSRPIGCYLQEYRSQNKVLKWINARQPAEYHPAGETNDGRGLRPPGAGDWVLQLTRIPIRESENQ